METKAFVPRAPDPPRHFSLPPSDFVVVYFGNSSHDERISYRRWPSSDSELSFPNYRVPVFRETGCECRLGFHESCSSGRILVEFKKLSRPSGLSMGGNDLVFTIGFFRETVPVSKPAKFLLTALALRVCSKRAARGHRVSALTPRQGETHLSDTLQLIPHRFTLSTNS